MNKGEAQNLNKIETDIAIIKRDVKQMVQDLRTMSNTIDGIRKHAETNSERILRLDFKVEDLEKHFEKYKKDVVANKLFVQDSKTVYRTLQWFIGFLGISNMVMILKLFL